MNAGALWVAKKTFTKHKGVMSRLRKHQNNLLHPDDRKSNEESAAATATATATATDVDTADDLSFQLVL